MHTGRRLFYRLRNFGLPANKLTFTRGDNNGETANTTTVEEVTVANYFAKQYRKLLYPNLSCINAIKGSPNKPNWLPMEMARVSFFNVNMRSFT